MHEKTARGTDQGEDLRQTGSAHLRERHQHARQAHGGLFPADKSAAIDNMLELVKANTEENCTGLEEIP